MIEYYRIIHWHGCRRYRPRHNLRHYHGICLVELNHEHQSRQLVSGPRCESGATIYEVGVLDPRI